VNYLKGFRKQIIVVLLVTIASFLCGCTTIEKTSTEQNNDILEDKWTITQYGPRDMNMSFYTIYNPTKGLIVIDGGWTEDEVYVTDIIQSLGGKVDAWIISHPHPDHVGAFNAIYPRQKELGVVIEEIYTVKLPSPEECLAVASWDNADAYVAFLSLDLPDVIYLNTGDVLRICGLDFEIFSAFDEQVRKKSKDYINDGSLMFKVYGETQEFLFCSDVGKKMTKHIIKNVGEEKLASDYIQMGHHGNGGLKENFYRLVSPSIAFFDSPDWLLYDETGKYTTPKNKALMEELGSEIKSFNSAPNSIVLE
jgi:beta-lactamase superfamily II metal-dependent hydrolase